MLAASSTMQSRFYHINGIVGNNLTTSSTNWEYNEMCQSISWLHVDTSRCIYLVRCPHDIILNVHCDASYLSAPKACSRAGGYFFLGSIPHDGDPIKLNGAIHITCTIFKHIAASAAEAELGALFLNAQEAKVLRLIFAELGHPQPPTPIHIDNTTTVGIVNNMIKCQRSPQWRWDTFGY